MLQASDLKKSYGGAAVLNGLSMNLQPGDMLGLVGINGSGKSTLLHIFSGLIASDSGNVTLMQENPRTASNAVLAKMAFIGQRHHALNELNAERYVRYVGSLYPQFDLAYARSLLARLDVPPKQAMLAFSEGQRQRVEVVRALSVRPALLLLDEPLSAVDPAGRRQIIQEILRAAQQEGAAVLLTTHIFSDIEHTSVELAILEKGKIRLRERIDTLKKDYVRIQCEQGNRPEFLIANKAGQLVLALPDGGWSAVLRRDALPDDLGVNFLLSTPSLEDIFLALANKSTDNVLALNA